VQGVKAADQGYAVHGGWRKNSGANFLHTISSRTDLAVGVGLHGNRAGFAGVRRIGELDPRTTVGKIAQNVDWSSADQLCAPGAGDRERPCWLATSATSQGQDESHANKVTHKLTPREVSAEGVDDPGSYHVAR
jgi:hypothetical protein